MLVRIHKDIFNDTSNNDDLNNILSFFRSKRHELILDDYNDIQACLQSNWAKSELNSRDLKLIKEFIKASTKKDNNRLLINLSRENARDYFTPKEAYLYLNQPLVILVENAEFEPPFINAIMNNFDNTDVLIYAKNEQWWKYVMDAGSSVTQVINGDIDNHFDNILFTKAKSRYLRYFVIIDSDKEFSEMEVEPVIAKEDFLNSIDVKYHVLYKREKENYMPINILENLDSSYFKLYIEFKTDEQKDFFDIEKGFKNKNKSDGNWKPEVKELFDFANVSKEDWDILKKGAIQMKEFEKKFKAEFSKLFLKCDKENMLKRISHQPKYRDDRNEFDHIVNEIKNLL